MLLGCKPFCVEEVDISVQDGWIDSFQIKIDRIPESCAFFGAIAGANYVISLQSKRSSNWQQIVKIHHDDPLYVSSDNIRIVNEQVGYSFWVNTFVVTTDGGQTHSIWSVEKDLPDFKLPEKQYSNWATIEHITVLQDGTGHMWLKRSQNENDTITRLATTDFGQNWTPLK